MSSSATRNEKRRLRDEENNRRWNEEAAEQRRKDALTMNERIEESDASDSVKDILHRLAVTIGEE